MSEQHSKEIRSIVTSEGNVELSIAVSKIPVPSDDEVLIKVGASPINPSDLALLLSFAADMDTITSTGSGDDTVTTIISCFISIKHKISNRVRGELC